MRIEIVKQKDAETREVYRFNTFDYTIVFVGYSLDKRPQGKRLWRSVDIWDNYIRASDENLEPDLPDEIREAAKVEAAKKIRVLTWDEWKK